MPSERWRTCTDIFHDALARAPDERSAFLERSCAGDPDLRKQVETLLKYHDEAGEFIASSAAAEAPELLTEDPDALIGQQLGNYRIDGVLGVGGMGVVYLGHDERLGRKVGLKLLPRSLVNDETQLERLKFEARTVSGLNHPNIVTVHEIGQADSTHFIAIEFIEGVTLRERIALAPIPADETVEVAIQVASALCVAHKAGIVHRDIKPENIMIRPDGYVKVLDFGIAKSSRGEALGEAAAVVGSTKTQLGVVLGTARYMSPEQARGDTVDARSDIWSVGVVLYEVLTGTAPFDGKTPGEVKNALLRDEPASLESNENAIPPALQRTVEKCLRKDPGERFQSSEELLSALRAARGRDRGKARRNWIAASIGLALLLAGLAYLLSSRFSPSGETRDLALGRPAGIALSADGIVYVADFSQHAIRQINPNGGLTPLAGATGLTGSTNGAGTTARFFHPADVAIARDGNLYVADTNNHLIRKITPAGVVSTLAGRAGEPGSEDGPGTAARFRFPTSVALDREENAYVADFANHTIRKITPEGTVSTLAGSAGEPGSADGAGTTARFNQIHGVSVDGAGNVYAADFGNHTIRKISANGAVVSTLAGLAENPGSTDGAGNVARFSAPYDVAVDDNGIVFVADTSNHTIRRITPTGVVTTLAGVAGNVGSSDGIAGAAKFAVPAGVTLDRTGNIYIADFGNQAIRKINRDAVVSTMAVRTAPSSEGTDKSIAVLPFADLSPGHDQQYFSDGIAEEILHALTQVKGLKVAGRTSSFSFRGKNQDLRRIGAALGVAHILEGSVRTQGDKVRITAQLIQVSDGFHLWSETYDGDLRDVFSLQERIARAITGQLQVVLHGEQKSRLVKTATSSTEAYALFLQATAIFNRRDSARFPDAVAQLQEALRLDPKFARARARLASLSSITPGYDVRLSENAGDIVNREAGLAIELDPSLAEPHAALGQLLFTQRRFSEARAAYGRALALDADDAVANFWLGTLLSSTGHAKASAEVLDKVLANDPMLPNALLWRGWVHLQLGEVDEAERSIRRAADAGLTSVGLALAHVAQARGDNVALVDWLARGLEPFMRDLPAGTSRIIAAGTVGAETERAQVITLIEQYLATKPEVASGVVPLALIWLGDPKRALAIAQEGPTRNDTLFLPSLWTSAGRNARVLPEFSIFCRRSGLAEFWDRNGPASLCTKSASGDYVCEN
jgi:TolB-like protein/Flp pilus assembly protein TadD